MGKEKDTQKALKKHLDKIDKMLGVKVEKRFQECNQLEKMWRRRHYLTLPFKWVWFELFANLEVLPSSMKGEVVDDPFYPKGRVLWKLLVGLVQMKMKWYYTMEEVKERMGRYGNED